MEPPYLQRARDDVMRLAAMASPRGYDGWHEEFRCLAVEQFRRPTRRLRKDRLPKQIGSSWLYPNPPVAEKLASQTEIDSALVMIRRDFLRQRIGKTLLS